MKRAAKGIFSFLLVLAVLVSAGCGGSGTDSNNGSSTVDNAKDTEPEGGSQTDDTPGDGEAMGRYIENLNSTLTESLDYRHHIVKMDNGSLAIMDDDAGKWVSEDNGETWQDMTPDEYREITGDNYIVASSIAPDGTIGIVYNPEIEEQEADNSYGIEPRYIILSPDGTQKELHLPNGDKEYVMAFYFSNDNRLFATALDGKIYEVNMQDDSYEVFTERESWVGYLEIEENRLLCADSKGITIFDLETKEVIEDKVLDEFIATNLGISISSAEEGSYNFIPILEDNITYIIFNKGIYRHVIGGSAVEQIVDGGLNSLGNPSNGSGKSN